MYKHGSRPHAESAQTVLSLVGREGVGMICLISSCVRPVDGCTEALLGVCSGKSDV